MKVGTGNGLHCHHAPHDVSSIVIPKRLLPTNVTQNIQTLQYFKVSLGSIVTMAREEFRCNISRRQVSNIAQFAKMATCLQDATNTKNLGEDIPSINLSDPDALIQYFKKSNIPHLILSHHKDLQQYELQGEALKKKNAKSKTIRNPYQQKGKPDQIANERTALVEKSDQAAQNGYITMECSDTGTNNEAFNLPEDQIDSMLEYSNDSRSSLLLPNEQSVMLSFMWSSPHCRRIFQAYPEVIYVDCTHGTNSICTELQSIYTSALIVAAGDTYQPCTIPNTVTPSVWCSYALSIRYLNACVRQMHCCAFLQQ